MQRDWAGMQATIPSSFNILFGLLIFTHRGWNEKGHWKWVVFGI